MAPSNHHLISFLLSLFFFMTVSQSQPSFRPKALILPVTKDPSSLQYLTQLNQRTPLVPVKLTLDLGGQYLWVDYEKGYLSSSYKPALCGSAQCSLAKTKTCFSECCSSSPKPGSYNNTCGLIADNTVSQTYSLRQLGQDFVTIQSTDGSNPGKIVKVPNFILTCAATFMLQGLAKGVEGMAGLGWTKISLPAQFSAAFSFRRKFAICLSSGKGVVFFGDGPYNMLPTNIDISKSLIYTPLIFNNVSTASAHFAGDTSSDYFIGVNSIKVNGKNVPLNKTLLQFDEYGFGGMKMSTVQPYTVLHASIHKAVVTVFAKELSGVPTVAGVGPFELCYNSTAIGSTPVGPAVPVIDLVLQSSNVYWRIYGGNSMVQVKEDVICLGIVDGGENPTTPIVIGGHQVEDNLLQFDLAASRLGFSSSLLFRQTSCANFDYTSTA
ncbi:unnamed protein product [Linum trigynum]|uniref:Peptidase A1 domain-containing protein n=2 Tax=Linum trigynum TaxID=586398 RepID=A0AAV2GMK4_9ROSI